MKIRNELTKKFGLKKSWSGDSNPHSPTQYLSGRVPLKNRAAMLKYFSDPENGWVENSTGLVEGYVGYKKQSVTVTIQKVGGYGNEAAVSIKGPKKSKPLSGPYYD